MRTLRGLVLCIFAALMAADVSASRAETRQDFDRFPFFAPSPWYRPYFSPWRQRYNAAPRKRKAVHSVQRQKLTQPRKRRQAALAIANRGARPRVSSIAARKGTKVAIIAPKKEINSPKKDEPNRYSTTCETAQAIVAEYGFKDISAEICIGNYLNFNATRDGKPFWVQILAESGELSRVKRLR